MTARIVEVAVICNAKHTEKKLLELIKLKHNAAQGCFQKKREKNRKRFKWCYTTELKPSGKQFWVQNPAGSIALVEVIVYCTSR